MGKALVAKELPPVVDYGITPEFTVTDLISVTTLPGDLKRYTFAIREKDEQGRWQRRRVVDLLVPAACIPAMHQQTAEDMASSGPFLAEAGALVPMN